MQCVLLFPLVQCQLPVLGVEFSHIVHIPVFPSHKHAKKHIWDTLAGRWGDGKKTNKKTKSTHTTTLSFLFFPSRGWRAGLPNVSLREEALSPSPPSHTESVGYFRHRGLFDQTPTTLRSFLTSLTSNVWHSRLATDQPSAPRRGPTGPGQMPLHVGPDHMNGGQARAPREPPHPHALHRIRAWKEIAEEISEVIRNKVVTPPLETEENEAL